MLPCLLWGLSNRTQLESSALSTHQLWSKVEGIQIGSQNQQLWQKFLYHHCHLRRCSICRSKWPKSVLLHRGGGVSLSEILVFFFVLQDVYVGPTLKESLGQRVNFSLISPLAKATTEWPAIGKCDLCRTAISNPFAIWCPCWLLLRRWHRLWERPCHCWFGLAPLE